MTDNRELGNRNIRFIDMHHHILYGLDDGPESKAEMEHMLEAAAQDGTGIMIATPHVFPGKKRFSMEDYERTLGEANAYCRRKALPLKVLGGAEMYFTDAAVRFLDEGKIPTMNGTRFVLTEWSTHEEAEEIIRGIGALCSAGYTPIIAHIERLRALRGKWALIEKLRDTYDLRIQMDCEAVPRGAGLFLPSFARDALKRGIVDYVASDAHDVNGRRSQMRQTYETIKRKWDAGLAERLMSGNAEELLESRNG